MFLGLRTIIYPAPDLAASKEWFTQMLGVGPYFDEPFYVGFEVGGYELGLHPAMDPADGPLTYWGVADADEAVARLIATGAVEREAVTEVGEGIRTASVKAPTGDVIGVIENPHFQVKPVIAGPGPGR
jgi:hypothetical protein